MLRTVKNHETDNVPFAKSGGFGADGAALPLRFTHTESVPASEDLNASAKPKPPPTSPTLSDEIGFINGINQADGTITNTSYWGSVGKTAFKWGSSTLGTTGGTINYVFDKGSHWTAQEQSTLVKAMTFWSAIADVQFKEVKNGGNVTFVRGSDGGAYTSTPTSNGHGSTLGSVTGPAKISIDTSVPGFDLSGSFSLVGGYGVSTIIHEMGHLLGLGHGGAYNGNVDPATQQFSAYDDRMFSIMSYISWADTDAKYLAQNPIQGTDWGTFTYQGNQYDRTAPHTMMGLDIIDIQELYGASKHSPFTGGQTYGFHSNIAGVLHDFYDFTVNTSPVVTLYNQGTNNTLDLTGYTGEQLVTLASGGFSNVGGLANNLFIDFNTQINHLITGSGNDLLIANDYGDRLEAGAGLDLLATGAGSDTMSGGAGNDTFYFYRDSTSTSGGTDDITDFAKGDKIQIVISGVTKFSDLTITSDGHGGSLVKWAGETLDVEHVKSLKSSDFAFGTSNVPAAFQAMLGGNHGQAATTEDLAALHYAPAFDHMMASHMAIV